MNNPIRILLVDDSPYFLDVARDFLAMQESLEVAGEVRDGSNALEHARAIQPDVILLDLNLGSESGMKLIPILKQSLPDTKIIVLTIQSGDDYHAAALQAGADAFVNKVNMMQDLIAAIFNVVGSAAPAQSPGANPAEKRVAAFQGLIENADDLIYRYDFTPKRGFVFVNAAAAKLTGYTPEEHYADPDLGFKLVHPDDRHLLEDAAQGKLDPAQPLTLRWLRKDGSIVWTEQRNVNIFNEEGELIAIEGIARDMTEPKRAEEQLRFQAMLVDNMHGAVVSTDAGFNIRSWNQAAERMFGYSEEEVIGRPSREVVASEFVGVSREEAIKELLGAGKWEGEVIVTRKDGRKVHTSATSSVIRDAHGKVIGMLAINRDITARKQAEADLSKSEARLQNVLRHAAEAILIVNEDGLIESFNLGAQKIFGYNESEIKGKPLDLLMPPQFTKLHLDHMRDFAASDGSGRMMGSREEITCVRKDGSMFQSQIGISKHTEGGRVVFTAIVLDITPRKQAEEELRKTEGRFRTLFENSPVAIWEEDFSQVKARLDDLARHGVTDLEAHLSAHPEVVEECVRLVQVRDVNRAALTLYQVGGKEELMGSLYKTFPEEALAGFKNELLTIARGESGFRAESRVRTFRGSERHVLVDWVVAPGHERGYSQVLVSLTDISQQKQVEESLNRSERRFRALIENGSDEVSILAADGALLYESPSANPTLGYRSGEFLGRSLFDLIHPDDRERIRSAFARLVRDASLHPRDEFRLRHRNGDWVWVEAVGTNLLDDPTVGGIVINYHAISERKRSEEALRRSESLLLQTGKVARVGGWDLDLENNVLRWSPETYHIHEVDPTTVPDLEFAINFYAPEARPMIADAVQQGIDNGRSFDLELPFITAKGNRLWVRAQGQAEIRNGKCVRLFGAFQDITGRKQAEETLRRTQQFYHSILEDITEMIIRFLPDGTLTYVNEAYCRYYGKSRGELIGSNFIETAADDLPQKLRAHFDSFTPGRPIAAFEHYDVLPGGEKRWREWVDRALFDGNGRLVEFQSTGRDITERKRSESALRMSEARYRELFESNPHPMWVYDLETLRFLAVNDAAVLHYGYTRPEFYDMTIKDIRPPGDVERLLENIAHVTEGSDEAGIWRHTKKDGSLIEVEITSHVLDFGGRRAEMVLAHDVTERRRAEEKLRRSESRYRLALQATNDVIWEWDTDTSQLVWSENAQAVFGYSIHEIGPDETWWDERVHPDDRGRVIDKLEDVRKSAAVFWTDEYRFLRKDGSYALINDRGYIERDGGGGALRMVGAMSDITARKLAEENLRRRVAELEALYQSGIAFSRSLDGTDIGEKIIEVLSGRLDWHHAVVRVRRGESDELETLAFSRSDEKEANERVRATISRLGQGMAGWVIENGQSLRSGDLGSDPRYVETYPGMRSGLYVPIKIQGMTIGCINVESELESAFTDEDERLLSTLALQAAVALENTRLFQSLELELAERRRAESELRQRADEFSALYDAARSLAGETDLQNVLQTILDQSIALLGAVNGTVALYDEERDELVLAAKRDFPAEIGERRGMGEGMAGIAAQTRQPLVVEDYDRWEHRVASLAGADLHAAIEVPLIYHDRLIGTIGVGETGSSRKFDETDARLLSLIGAHAAGAVENARLFQFLHNELNERKLAEKALAESEARYRSLLDQLPAIVYLDDLQASPPTTRFVSPRILDILGYSPEEWLAGGFDIWKNVLHPDDRERVAARYMDSAGRESSYLQEYRMIARNGRTLWVRDSAVIQRDHDGNPLAMQGVVYDITENKQAEERIRRQVERLTALQEADRAIASTFDMELSLNILLSSAVKLLSADAAAVLLLNPVTHSLEYVSGLGFRSRIVKSASVKLGESYAGRAAQDRHPVHFSNIAGDSGNLFPDGFLKEEMFVDYHGVPLIVKGQTLGVLEIFNRADVERDDEWLNFLEALAGQAAIAVDNAQLFAASQRELVERKQAQENLRLMNLELENRIEARTADLRQANSELERALRIKDEFLANMSHELRTPLNAVIGLSESLEEEIAGTLNEKQKKYVNTIHESGEHLLELINDILDLAKIEAGQVALDRSAVDVDSVCQSSLRMIKQLAHKKKQTVRFEMTGVAGGIQADERRLKQMIVNLLGNAVKFTVEGGELGLQVTGDAENHAMRFTVWDKGIGIHEDDLPRLFKPFVQLDANLARRSGGTGLGLALVAKMAGLHGGSVSVESQPGEGSRFTIALPWEPSSEDSVHAMSGEPGDSSHTPDPDRASRTILLVDDTNDIIMLFRDYLEYAGYKVALARNGVEGVKLAEELRPSLILMDVQMPVMDGMEAARNIRRIPALDRTPIIALTALAMKGDRERCLEAGMNDYLSKPVMLRTLLETIEKHLSPGRQESQS